MTQPNVLFILADCLRSRAIFDPTRGADIPTLRATMARGASFDTCIATATTTSPSMGSIFTGVFPFEHGIRSLRGYKLNPERPTWAEAFRDASYRTHAEATGPVVEHKDFDRGFDTFNHRNATLYRPAAWDRIQGELAGMPSDRPWFFYLHLWELHRPRFLPKDYDRRRYGAHRYERALSALDHERFGKILELAGENTIVVLTGDHGEIPRYDLIQRAARKLKLRRIKAYVDTRSGHGHDVTEDLVKVPLVLSGPGVPAAGTIPTAIRHVDILPTVCELAGVRAPAGMAGRSVVPLFDGQGEDRPGYSEAVGVTLGGGPERWLVSVRDGGYKLVKRASGDERELWRLDAEHVDVAGEQPEVLERLEGLLTELQAGSSLTATGADLSSEESAEVEEHLRDLGYID